MKALIAALTLALFSSVAAADEIRLVNSDGSELSQLCIAAAETGKPVMILARNLGLGSFDLNELRCNGKPLHSFVSQLQTATPVVTQYQINLGDETPESMLCRAAVTSDAEFARLKETHFARVLVETEVSCNGMPLNRFVRRYQGQAGASL